MSFSKIKFISNNTKEIVFRADKWNVVLKIQTCRSLENENIETPEKTKFGHNDK